MNEQIEAMAKVTMEHCEIDNQCGSCHWSTCNECLAECLYNAGHHKPEWININDSIPNETQDYLVVLNDEDIDILLFNSKNDPYQTWSSMLNKFLFVDNKGEWHSTDRVTHWMPLPEAPKGDVEE